SNCVVHFFFSSRRRHTRFSRDWSSDVCSSDLVPASSVRKSRSCLPYTTYLPERAVCMRWYALARALTLSRADSRVSGLAFGRKRSEERRVGKECRGGGSTWEGQEKN